MSKPDALGSGAPLSSFPFGKSIRNVKGAVEQSLVSTMAEPTSAARAHGFIKVQCLSGPMMLNCCPTSSQGVRGANDEWFLAGCCYSTMKSFLASGLSVGVPLP